jgi:predicted dehydrogenase
MNNDFTPSRLTRRQFTTGLAAAATVLGAPAILRGRNLNDRLNIAIIGSGGRGAGNAQSLSSQNIVILCDVDETKLDAAATLYPQAKKFIDFRQVYEHANEFDAVAVSTCEHTHAFATLPALQLGKHVYCEKPLTHNIWEARIIREAAAKANVATQMGIQIHATDNYRRVVEKIRAGLIGPVSEAHVWVSRAWGDGDRPSDQIPVPKGLHWDLWIGPAPYRPFHNEYFPGPRWYKWWDFGNGTMSDLGSHWNDLPFWALDLHHPLTIEANGPPPHSETAPASMHVRYEFPARGQLPPVTLTWYQGVDKPEIWTNGGIPQWENGVLFIGGEGMLLADYGKHVLLPEEKFADTPPPEPTIPSSPGQHEEWVDACKTGKTPLSNFEYSGWLTESNHLGNVAFRSGMKLEWDPENLRATNAPDADRFIHREYRSGWKLI